MLAIVAIGIYYFRKQKIAKGSTSAFSKQILNDSIEESLKNTPYDEMLKMNEDDFRNCIAYRAEMDRERLLLEMIEHEERTGSFRSTAKKELSGAEQMVLAVVMRSFLLKNKVYLICHKQSQRLLRRNKSNYLLAYSSVADFAIITL